MNAEIGHLYMNQKFDVKNINYLDHYSFLGIDRLLLFIDDYHAEQKLIPELDVDWALRSFENRTGRKVEVFFEADMCKYLDEAYDFLRRKYLTFVHDEDNKFLETRFNGKRLFDHTQPDDKQASCQMLSYTWAMFRLGLVGNEFVGDRVETMTLIDKKYMKLEERVIEMVPEAYRGRMYYQFY